MELTATARAGRFAHRSLAGNLVFFVGLLAFAVVAWPARFGGRAMLVVVQGTSMRPSYSMGDMIYARRVHDANPGDIVIYRIPVGEPGAGQTVIHRVVSRRADGHYVLKGDAKRAADDAHPAASDLVARAAFNLGPLPTRFMASSSLLATLGVSISVGWYLWPVSGRVRRRARTSVVETNRARGFALRFNSSGRNTPWREGAMSFPAGLSAVAGTLAVSGAAAAFMILGMTGNARSHSSPRPAPFVDAVVTPTPLVFAHGIGARSPEPSPNTDAMEFVLPTDYSVNNTRV